MTGRQPPLLDDLTPQQQQQVRWRLAHLLEAETGFRSGDAHQAAPGEPRACYDPATTTLGQRRRAKVAELGQLGREEARMLGLAQVGERTLERWGVAYQRLGIIGLIDGRLLRRSGGRRSLSPEVTEAILAVRAETLHRSKMSMTARERLIGQYVRETFGPHVVVPHYHTLRRVWAEWFGPGGTRQRYARSAAAVDATIAHGQVVIHRPGQVVALDTTLLPVKVREHTFGEPVSTYLSLALDGYTHSLLGFRLALVSDTSVDVAMLLRDVMTPKRMRRGWDEEVEWSYPGIPAAEVARLAGYAWPRCRSCARRW